ncbi:MAG: TatD family hydrolase [Clostridia bacterium]|nr:TatD family hydrolase [Clostridia bacterium]
MRLFDTHAHLTDSRFDEDRGSLISSLPEKGIALVVDVACGLEDAHKVVTYTEQYPFIYGAAGIHPHDAEDATLAELDGIAKILEKEKFVALGEIGLDYHYDFSPRDVQRKWFVEQLELAKQMKLPVSLHIREAFGDCMEILRQHKDGLCGVMHCYSGSWESAVECIDLGLHIAFGGSVTFKNARKLAEVAAQLPIERLLIETDCPYLTPEPYRGRRNDPSYVRHVAEKLAELRGCSTEEIAEATYQNGIRLFGIKG